MRIFGFLAFAQRMTTLMRGKVGLKSLNNDHI
jgi:hypothetical protein